MKMLLLLCDRSVSWWTAGSSLIDMSPPLHFCRRTLTGFVAHAAGQSCGAVFSTAAKCCDDSGSTGLLLDQCDPHRESRSADARFHLLHCEYLYHPPLHSTDGRDSRRRRPCRSRGSEMAFERFLQSWSIRFKTRLGVRCSYCSETESDSLVVLSEGVAILETIIAGFDDYTNDQRGDVGSWVRLASIASISKILPLAQGDLLTQERLDRIVASLLKQTVERLDNVREAAGVLLESIAGTAALYAGNAKLRGQDLFREMRFVLRSAPHESG